MTTVENYYLHVIPSEAEESSRRRIYYYAIGTLFTAVYGRGGVRGISSAEQSVVFIHFVNKSSREIQKIVESSTTCDRDGSL